MGKETFVGGDSIEWVGGTTTEYLGNAVYSSGKKLIVTANGTKYFGDHPEKTPDIDKDEEYNDYQLLRNGIVKVIKNRNKTEDRLYASDENEKIILKTFIIMTKGIIGQLQFYRDGNKSDIFGAYHQAIKEYSGTIMDDMLKLFLFGADNSEVEFSFCDFYIGTNRFLSVQTFNSDQRSPGMNAIGVAHGKEKRIIHNHPANQSYATKQDPYFTEEYSMGKKGKIRSGDFYNVTFGIDDKYPINYSYQVYFPGTKNLYDIHAINGIRLIKKINNHKDLK